jgi:zinc and cadmium transporter
VLIAISSLMGGYLPSLVKLTHARMQILVSMIGGLMLGVAIFHQLPHAVGALSGHDHVFALDWCVGWLMAGLLTTFFMLRLFHFHNHEPVATDDDRDHLCAHDHDAGSELNHSHHPTQGASWIGIFLGLSIHTLIDGAALAANVQADALHDSTPLKATTWLLGLGTFLGVVLHKPLDSLSITTLMTAGGWSWGWRNLVNIGYSLMCPLGAAGFILGLQQFNLLHDVILAAALAFSAGVFLCISLSDLLPEVQFHSHDRLKLSCGLLIGVFLAYGIGFLEPAHTHGHQGGISEPSHSESHHHH